MAEANRKLPKKEADSFRSLVVRTYAFFPLENPLI